MSVQASFAPVLAYLAANPFLVVLLVGAVASVLAKLAPSHPRLASALRVFAHAGFNVGEVVRELNALLNGAPVREIVKDVAKAVASTAVGVFLLLSVGLGCKGASSPSTPLGCKAVSVALVTAGAAYVDAAKACATVADPVALADCKTALLPVGPYLEEAAASADACTDIVSGDVACVLDDARAGLLVAQSKFQGDAGAGPASVAEALGLLASFSPQCNRDAGAKDGSADVEVGQ